MLVVSTGVTLSLAAEARSQFEQYEEKGMDAVKHTGFVLVAGGLGERLGYSGIKVRLLYRFTHASFILVTALDPFNVRLLGLQTGLRSKLPVVLRLMQSASATWRAVLVPYS